MQSDTTERLDFHFSLSCIGEGNGNPLQCSCLENPRDGGAWWAAVYGVSLSQTQLKRLSSSGKQRSNPLSPVLPKDSLPLYHLGTPIRVTGMHNKPLTPNPYSPACGWDRNSTCPAQRLPPPSHPTPASISWLFECANFNKIKKPA